MTKSDIKKAALAAHKRHQGKIEIAGRAPLRNKKDLSLYYTPGVAAVSSYVAAHKNAVRDYTLAGRTVAVVSDGSAVLGLGNIGPEGALPVMEGKALLFKEFGGVDAFPIVLNANTADEIIAAVKAIAPGFGGINLEDIAAPKCFEVEERLMNELDIPVMHDDQHGTAVVVLAGLINAFKAVKKDIKKSTVAVIGAGAAGTAIAKLLVLYGIGDIIVADSRGIIDLTREDLDERKKELARLTNKNGRSGDLLAALEGADAVIGVSKGGLLSAVHIRRMAKDPIVFAMANPDPEILPIVAKAAGAKVVATGRSDFENQINNVLAFPGIFKGALENRVRRITPEIKIRAAERLAALVAKPTASQIIPSVFDKRVVKAVAGAVKTQSLKRKAKNNG